MKNISYHSYSFPIIMDLKEAHEFIKEYSRLDGDRANTFAFSHALALMSGELVISKVDYEDFKKISDSKLQKFFDKTFAKHLNIKEGTPCLVSVVPPTSTTFGNWVLRYANGKGKFYEYTQKSGKIKDWPHAIPLTPETLKDLPFCK